MSCPKPSVRSPKAFSCARLGERLTTVLYAHGPGRNGRANDNSCPSGSSMWKYRSPQEAFRGFSGPNPRSLKRLQSASTSATWKISRPQPLTRSPCSKLRMAESASFARREENPAVPPLRRAPPYRAHPDRTARRRSCSRLET